MERDWVFGNVVCIYCHWLFCFVFETVREEVVYLSGVSVSYVECLKSWVFVRERSGIFGTWSLPWFCTQASCLSFYVSILHCCLLPGCCVRQSWEFGFSIAPIEMSMFCMIIIAPRRHALQYGDSFPIAVGGARSSTRAGQVRSSRFWRGRCRGQFDWCSGYRIVKPSSNVVFDDQLNKGQLSWCSQIPHSLYLCWPLLQVWWAITVFVIVVAEQGQFWLHICQRSV